jgi:hypothetical protein
MYSYSNLVTVVVGNAQDQKKVFRPQTIDYYWIILLQKSGLGRLEQK